MSARPTVHRLTGGAIGILNGLGITIPAHALLVDLGAGIYLAYAIALRGSIS